MWLFKWWLQASGLMLLIGLFIELLLLCNLNLKMPFSHWLIESMILFMPTFVGMIYGFLFLRSKKGRFK